VREAHDNVRCENIDLVVEKKAWCSSLSRDSGLIGEREVRVPKRELDDKVEMEKEERNRGRAQPRKKKLEEKTPLRAK
jgi:hypothetical protein